MKEAVKPRSVPPRKLTVGTRVSLKFALRRITGTIVEDRGPIGIGGRRLFAVRAKYDGQVESVSEWPAEKLRPIGRRRAA
jgi:hypothetical protein